MPLMGIDIIGEGEKKLDVELQQRQRANEFWSAFIQDESRAWLH